MGEVAYKVDEFSQEELAALGEADQTTPAVEKAEQDVKPEPESEAVVAPEGEAEAKTEQKEEVKQDVRFEDGYIIDSDGERIPLKRFKEVYWEAKGAERAKTRLDLLKKLGPDEFYRIHPDEAPEGWTPKQEPQVDPSKLVAQYDDPSHQYHGMTLGEINKVDALEAHRLLKSWESTQEVAKKAKERVRNEDLERSSKEASELAAIVAADKYGKTDLDKLTAEEVAEIKDLIQDTYTWGAKNGKTRYSVADMWIIRQKLEKQESTTAQERAMKALEGKEAVKSIGNGGGTAQASGFEAYLSMTEDQLVSVLDNMKDKELREFYHKAPASFRKKYPALPWE